VEDDHTSGLAGVCDLELPEREADSFFVPDEFLLGLPERVALTLFTQPHRRGDLTRKRLLEAEEAAGIVSSLDAHQTVVVALIHRNVRLTATSRKFGPEYLP
jgi:hypothetical protein